MEIPISDTREEKRLSSSSWRWESERKGKDCFDLKPAPLTMENIWGDVAAEPAELQAELEKTFSDLVSKWYKETAHLSVVCQKAMHPAYQRIIGMGDKALPLILRELQKKKGHWFWALNAITGEDPAKPKANYREAVETWLRWGQERGLIANHDHVSGRR